MIKPFKNIIGLCAGLCLLSACFSTQPLWDTFEAIDDPNAIGSLSATSIYTDVMNNEIWFEAVGGKCVTVTNSTEQSFEGEKALHVQWDKGQGCSWVGVGFGWDNWSGKNFTTVYNKTAIQFKVKSSGPELNSLPWAMCLEDYGGLQAWTGFNRKMIDEKIITKDQWSTVNIPVTAFNWAEFGTDVTNIKQFIIQLEASGDLFIDDIKVVPYEGSLNNLAKTYQIENDQDGFSISNSNKTFELDGHKVLVYSTSESLVVEADIIDKTPAENSRTKSEIWNGDALELAISTDASSDPRRSFYKTTDHQIGVKPGDDAELWNWKKNRFVENGSVITELTDNGYRVKATIPLTELDAEPFETDIIYGFEFAIDLGTLDGRNMQLRWNNPDSDGFYNNPSLWGEIMFKQKDELP